MMQAKNYIYDWNQIKKIHPASEVQIEDDTLRDGLQGAFLTKPTLQQKLPLIEQMIEIGVQQAMLGFPSASEAEFNDSREILRYLDVMQLPLDVYFLARAKKIDVDPIIKLSQGSDRSVCADFFIGMSQLRCHIERWEFSEILRNCANLADYLNIHHTDFSISLEDISRSTPEEIEKITILCLQKGAKRITLCDTVGAMTPEGTARLVNFVKNICDINKNSEVMLGWHGHNDNGLALANAIIAINSGINFISGSFMGIGERTGNVALEQVILFLHQHYKQLFDIEKIATYCDQLANMVNYSIPEHAPIIGRQAFSTATGTHASAIMKAAKLGLDFEDLIFSSVPASSLGRMQEIYLNYNSGTANVAYLLEKLGIEKTPENIRCVLQAAKINRTCLTKDDVLKCLKTEEIL